MSASLLGLARRAAVPLEHDEQVRLFEWAALAAGRHPELRGLYAVPNGGHRHVAVAAKLKAEGVKAGYPDVGLDVARGGHHGLRIEMKRRKGGRVESEQAAWHEWLRSQGYHVAVCRGWEEARDVLLGYLGER